MKPDLHSGGSRHSATIPDTSYWNFTPTATIGLTCLAMAFVLTGCTALRVKLGQRKYLAKLPVTTMQASLPAGGIAPGEKSQLVVTFTQADGTVWKTEGKGKGEILWQDLQVSATVVKANSKGVLTLDPDP